MTIVWSLQPLFWDLLDDAALFPPGDAPMRSALDRHHETQQSHDARFVRSFVCPSSRLDELNQQLPAELTRLDLSLVAVGGASAIGPALDVVRSSPRLVLRAIELPARHSGVVRTAEALQAQMWPDVAGYVVLDPGPSFRADAQAAAEAGLRVKIRTGGTDVVAFPSEQVLADCIAACLDVAVPFKLTAGLHRAVRHRDPLTGFEHHGFLNVLGAVAQSGSGIAGILTVLAERDGDALTERMRGLSDEDVAQVRRRFVSFGTCSISDPLADLRAMGLLPQEES